MNDLKTTALAQIDSIEEFYAELDRKKVHDDFSGGIRPEEYAQYTTRALAAIERIAGKEHSYSMQARATIKTFGGVSHAHIPPILHGILQALRQDVGAEFLLELRIIEHASLFSDFLEMAAHLLQNGYKDPAAVLIGGTLESHLKQLAQLNSVSPTDSNGKSKGAERLNEELGKKAYNLLQQKTITSWLDLRNKAAHADYGQYTADQVRNFGDGLRNFMLQFPA
jgi:hypothetical protein